MHMHLYWWWVQVPTNMSLCQWQEQLDEHILLWNNMWWQNTEDRNIVKT